jgi:hypothetical protein
MQTAVTRVTDSQTDPMFTFVKMKFGFRTTGRDHEVGDANCAGCAAMEGGHYPRPHNEYQGVRCPGLVHAEKVDNPAKTVYMCDACNANPT